MKKNIKTSNQARQSLIDGINKLSDSVISTLGPSGRNVIFIDNGNIVSTKDGVSVAKSINLEDPSEDLGAQLIKQASIKTADLAGDGTTTSTLLAKHIINSGIKYLNNNSNATQIKLGIEDATKQIINDLRNNLKENISNETQLTQIATISANNDEFIGKLIAEAMDKSGLDGVVYIDESKTGETYLETVEGIQFDKGYKSPYFVTNNNTMTAHLEDALVLILDKKLTTVKELLPILQHASSNDKSLLIIAEDIDGESLSTLIVNKGRGSLKVCGVKAPDFGERRKMILEDIAILTGGEVISNEKGWKLERFDTNWFGKARIVTISKEQTTIIDGNGDKNKIENRIEELKSQIEKTTSPYEKEKLQERLARFCGGVSIIYVGGNTETEMREKKDRVDDALQATKAALEEGIVAGGGTALLRCDILTNENNHPDFRIGQQLVYNACKQPFIQILKNAGYADNVIFNLMNQITKSENKWDGYDIKSQTITNLKEKGIIDPVKVTRCALENASSVAATVLLTEVILTDIPEDNKQQEFDPMSMM